MAEIQRTQLRAVSYSGWTGRPIVEPAELRSAALDVASSASSSVSITQPRLRRCSAALRPRRTPGVAPPRTISLSRPSRTSRNPAPRSQLRGVRPSPALPSALHSSHPVPTPPSSILPSLTQPLSSHHLSPSPTMTASLRLASLSAAIAAVPRPALHAARLRARAAPRPCPAARCALRGAHPERPVLLHFHHGRRGGRPRRHPRRVLR